MVKKTLQSVWAAAFTVYTNLVYMINEKPKGVDFILTDKSAMALSASASYYASVPKRTMQKVFCNIPILPEDSFLDIGSGKGHVLYLAHQMGFGRVHGIDLSHSLCETALRNISALHLSGKVTVDCISASDFNEFDKYSYLFMANPFSEEVMQKVVDNIEQSLRHNPRKITIIYLNPRCHQVLDGCALLWLAEKRFVRVYNPLKKWSVYYYESACDKSS